jgi:hypothetical protein
MLAHAFERKWGTREGRRIPATIHAWKSAGGGTLMVIIRSKHLETLEAVIATALNIVRTRPLADLYVSRDYTGEFRIRVQPEGGRRYVITIKEE